MQGRYHLGGKEFDLTTEDMEINSTNFSVSKNGDIKATSGEIGGFTLGTNTFMTNLVSEKMAKYTYTAADQTRLQNIIKGDITPTSSDYDKYDFDYSGRFTSRDSVILARIINGTETGEASFILDTKNSEKAISIKRANGEETLNLGLFGCYMSYLTADNIYSTSNVTTNNAFVVKKKDGSIDWAYLGEGTYNDIYGGVFHLYNNQGISPISMFAQTGEINCVSINPTSKEENKKNFKRLESGLDIIKNIDIYKYNLKNEEDNTKKHIGFVIGDEYKYSKDITSKNNDGVDLYSFVSVCCKAIQEQQAEIEMLKDKINKLEGGEK